MRAYDHFRYTGTEQRWVAPKGVTQALFECWGAAGGMPSTLAWHGKVRQVVGGSAPTNNVFYNNPNGQGQLGVSFANGAGYAQGLKTVSEGDLYYVYVGGNGGPGHSAIKLKDNGNFEVSLRGGAGGYNGGGDGGTGALAKQNLFNSTSRTVHFAQNAMPGKAKVGQLWWDTNANLVYRCTNTYTSGGSLSGNWTKVTSQHAYGVGPSGGGGGGATDIRTSTDSGRILVAGGGGGAGGVYNKTGSGSWSLQRVPGTPAPPFGLDSASSGATGPDNTWCSSVNFLTGTWGLGGIGGGSGPTPNVSTTPDTGWASTGGSGGNSTARHAAGTSPKEVPGSGGHGGGPLAAGSAGNGGNALNGSGSSGGRGANAPGGNDDWAAGGGGGGGGYFGGGGGGYGFITTDGIHTRGGGGGGGSNYADPGFTTFFLAGAAQPPFGKGNSGTGANGTGGFARISYRLPPEVAFKSAPRSVEHGTAFDVVFDYTPARVNGPGIDHYVVGTATDPNATFPTSTTTVMVTDHTLTEFTHSFTAPAAGVQNAYFVQVVDTDGDASAWLIQKVTGLASSSTTPVTITSPASGATFEDSATVDWTVGTQTPLVAYRIGLSGLPHATALKSHPTEYAQTTGWRRGGSRVNLALDPGFVTNSVWDSTDNVNIASDATHPGVSGHNGKVTWVLTDAFDAENHTTTFDNLARGVEYRLHLGIASGLDHDLRPIEVTVRDAKGLLAHTVVDLSGVTAATYVNVDLPFVPHAQGVYVSVMPSASGTGDGDPIISDDFEDGTVGIWTGMDGHTVAADSTGPPVAGPYQGNTVLHVVGAPNISGFQGASRDIQAALLAAGLGAGNYVAQCWAFTPTAATDHGAVMRLVGAGITGGGTASVIAQSVGRGAWELLRIPFVWLGSGGASIQLDGDLATDFGGKWYDMIQVYALDNTSEPTFGNADSQQITYLKDMMIEMTFEGDTTLPTYFDGSHLNGLTGTVSWEGTANASPSYLTGTDVVTATATYSGQPLLSGEITVTTLAQPAVANGFDGAVASVPVNINPPAPASPTVVLTVDNSGGVMTLAINANDAGQPSTNKTVTFDIFRNGTRIATRLAPDLTTREAFYDDTPASGTLATYVVRAWSQSGGFIDQANGTVN